VEGVRIVSVYSLREAGKSEYLDVSHQLLSRYAQSTDNFFSKRLGINLYVSIANVLIEGPVQHPVSKKHNPLLHNLVNLEDKYVRYYLIFLPYSEYIILVLKQQRYTKFLTIVEFEDVLEQLSYWKLN
jgi:hypothetical protein